jgi:RNA polymerase sigma-70 factor (ECF subfamily)
MAANETDNSGGFFPLTRWGTILKTRGGDQEAFDRLMSRYRRPMILEIQSRRRCAAEEAEELTHEFIETLLRREFLKGVSPERGRFRAFVKQCIRHFLIDLSRRRAEPEQVPIGPAEGDERPGVDPAAPEPKEWPTLDREWVRALLEGAMERLERQCTEDGQLAYFRALRDRLNDNLDGNGYAEIAARLGVEEGAIRTSHSRLRKKLVGCLKDEVRETTTSAEDFRREWETVCEYAGAAPR